MKYYLIAGEASGDLHGSNLMQAILDKDAKAHFRFWGGDKMKKVGGNQVEHYKNTAFMGFWEVVKNLKKILGFLKKCKRDILEHKPDVLILIDYPGFNLRIAEFAKQNGIKVIYYISPQLWAWKENRIHKIKRDVDKMLVILPFEKPFYAKHDYPVEFVGHPLLDEIYKNKISKSDKNLNNNTIALLPGSRKQEISMILPLLLTVVDSFPNYNFVVAGLGHIEEHFYRNIIGHKKVDIVYDNTYNLLENSSAALVASGTATLEAALFKVPMIVAYKGSWLSYQIGKRLVKVKFIALANLVMDKAIVKELIQDELTYQNLKEELSRILQSETRNRMLNDYERLITKLGNSGASKRAAQLILNELNFTK